MKRLVLSLVLSAVLLLPVHAQVPPTLSPICTLYVLNISSYPVAGAWYVPEYNNEGAIPPIAPGEHQDLAGPCPTGQLGVYLESMDPRKTEPEQFVVTFGASDHTFILILDPQRVPNGAKTLSPTLPYPQYLTD